MKKRIPIVILLLLLAAGGGAYYWFTSRPLRSIVLTGIVTTDEVNVSSQVQGQLSRLLVKEGDTVQANQLLGVIQPQELKATQQFYAHSAEGVTATVHQAESALKYQELQTTDQIRQAEASLASSQAAQVEAAADLDLDKRNYDRTHELYQQGVLSAQQDDQARMTMEAAQAHLDSLAKQAQAAQAAVALAKSNEEQNAVRRNELMADEHQLAAASAQNQVAKVRLGYTEIRSPINGIVSLRSALQGEVVNIGQPIVTLINPDNLWVRTDVEETYIDSIRLGDHMMVRFPSGMEREGTVFYRGVDADFATQRDVSRTKRDIKTFEVRLHVDNSDRRLYPGLTAYVTVPLSSP